MTERAKPKGWWCVWCGEGGAGGESARMTVIGGGGGGRGSVSLSVCLGEETKVPVGGMGGKRQHGGECRETENQRGQRVFGVWTDGSKPYLFYRGAVHCVMMLDEKEQSISSRGRAFGFVLGRGEDE